MKRLLLIGTLLVMYVMVVVTTQLFSGNTGKIRGKIINKKSSDPVAFVVVQIKGTSMGTQANQFGEYVIINVPPGKYELCATLPGWTTVCVTELSVAANSTTTQDFSLEEAVVETQAQIVVTERDLLQQGATSDLRQITRESVKNMPMANMKMYCPPSIAYYPPAHGGNTPPNGEPVDAMFFKHYGVNPFISTEDDHLSTFAIDCDNASYTMTRAYLNDGNLPPEEAVRVEEFVNNFKYDFQFPHDRAFSVQLEGAPSRFGAGYQLLKVDIIGKKIRAENRKDANLTFVVDVSGSMDREDRLGMVRRSLRMLVDELTPRDNVGIVVYGS